MKNTISTFTLQERDIDIVLNNNKLAWTMTHAGKNYGGAVNLTSKKQMDIVNATFLLLINALETIEALKHEQPTV
jgi:hypothetical protein